MGLFSKTPKPPPQPLPNIELHLSSHQDQVFKPNDTVSGHVAITTPIPVNPQALEISFWGLSKTWIRTESKSGTNNSTTNYTHYRDNAPLFTLTQDAFIPPPDQKRITQLVPGQEYIFPFQFLVPEGTANNRAVIGRYKDDADSRWTVLPHNLPPTFFFGSNPEYPDQASVDYGVTTKLICPGLVIPPKQSFFSGIWAKEEEDRLSCTAPVLFQPLNPYANLPGPKSVLKYPKEFTLQSSSLTGAEPSSIGFRKKMHDRFSSGTPKLDFEIAIEVPDILVSGTEFKFRASFTALNKSDKVTIIPPVQFNIKEIGLLDFTFFRASHDWNATNTMSGVPYSSGKDYTPNPGDKHYRWGYDIYREKSVSLNAIPESHTIELAEVPVVGEKDRKEVKQEERGEIWFAARVPGFTPPSFTSFAITRAYRVKVKLGIVIGEKSFKHEVESHVRYLGSA
jgi:hypothetical protein